MGVGMRVRGPNQRTGNQDGVRKVTVSQAGDVQSKGHILKSQECTHKDTKEDSKPESQERYNTDWKRGKTQGPT